MYNEYSMKILLELFIMLAQEWRVEPKHGCTELQNFQNIINAQLLILMDTLQRTPTLGLIRIE